MNSYSIQNKKQSQVDQRLKYERQTVKHLENNIGEYFYKLKIRRIS